MAQARQTPQAKFGSPPLPDDLLAFVRRMGAGAAAKAEVAHLTRPALDGFLIHLDVDCLDDAIMPAVDYRIPGGLLWAELKAALRAALGSGKAVALEVVIYNPKLDMDGSAGHGLTDAPVEVLGMAATSTAGAE